MQVFLNADVWMGPGSNPPLLIPHLNMYIYMQVFLNADVWMGPGSNPPKILPADFFAACFDLYPAGTLRFFYVYFCFFYVYFFPFFIYVF
jgi:hypothetical protein